MCGAVFLTGLCGYLTEGVPLSRFSLQRAELFARLLV